MTAAEFVNAVRSIYASRFNPDVTNQLIRQALAKVEGVAEPQPAARPEPAPASVPPGLSTSRREPEVPPEAELFGGPNAAVEGEDVA